MNTQNTEYYSHCHCPYEQLSTSLCPNLPGRGVPDPAQLGHEGSTERAAGWCAGARMRVQVWARSPRAACAGPARPSPSRRGAAGGRPRARYLRRPGPRGQSPGQAASEDQHGAARAAGRCASLDPSSCGFATRRSDGTARGAGSGRARGLAPPPALEVRGPVRPIAGLRAPPRVSPRTAGASFAFSDLLTPNVGGDAAPAE